jgi:protein SFI1
MMRTALTRWTNRVIDIKLRELEVKQAHDNILLMCVSVYYTLNYIFDIPFRFAFQKWKRVCIRHVEELSLMESYQDVKREGTSRRIALLLLIYISITVAENIRRMFHRWLSAARAARHRRVTLHEKENEMKLSVIAVAWDQWRGRFNDEKLRPIVCPFSPRIDSPSL